MKFSEEHYLGFDPFQGDESETRCRTVKMVKAAKEHPCYFGQEPHYGDNHMIKKGEIHRHEKALIDQEYWGSWRCCTNCMDKHMSGDDPLEKDD